MAQKNKASSTQEHLSIKEIKDDVIILKNKGLRAVLMTTSVNFDLKSSDEQDAIIYRYQEFLNSLDFPLQILTISRRFNIDDYIEGLKAREAQQENELLKIQTVEYIDFVKGLTAVSNIMSTSFYLVVPYNPSVIKKSGFIEKIFSGKTEKNDDQQQKFQELKTNLWQRLEFVISGLRGVGIKTVPLKTDELIELFYKLYNPEAKEDPELKTAKELKTQ